MKFILVLFCTVFVCTSCHGRPSANNSSNWKGEEKLIDVSRKADSQFILNSPHSKILKRNVEKDNNDTINVKDFGALGNGIVDDGDAIQKAIFSLKRGQVLFIPEGRYLVRKTLEVKSNITILGEGKKTKLQYSWGKYSKTKKLIYGFLLTDAQNVTFRNFHIDGGSSNYDEIIIDGRNKQTWDVDGAYHLFFIKPSSDYAVSDIYFDNLTLSNSFFDAIHSYARVGDPEPKFKCKNIFINKVTFNNIGCHGVGVGLIYNMVVKNSTFKNVGLMKMLDSGLGSGMAVDVSAGSENVLIENNLVNGAGAGFKTETHENNGGRYLTSKNVTFIGNTIKNLYKGDAYKVFYGIKANGTDIKVENNFIESYSHGILIGKDASNCTIKNNKILNFRSDAAGIRCDKNKGGHQIIGNKIKDSKSQGILISNCNDVNVKSNIIVGSGSDNIRILGGRNIILDDNLCANAGTNNISVFPIIGMNISDVKIMNNICFDTDGSTKEDARRILVSNAQNVQVSKNKLKVLNTYSKIFSDSKSQQVNFSTEIPKTGQFMKGDFVVKKDEKLTAGSSKIIGWKCVESGNPGKWSEIQMDF